MVYIFASGYSKKERTRLFPKKSQKRQRERKREKTPFPDSERKEFVKQGFFLAPKKL